MSSLDTSFPSECHKLELFQRHWDRVSEMDGALAEFGVCNGGGARQLASLSPVRLVYAFDTYEGMPSADYHKWEDSDNPPGKWKPKGTPQQMFEGIANIVPVVGRFAETFPTFPQDTRFILAHIDCDYYESYRQVLDFLHTRMQHGGIAEMDEYGSCRGATRAVDEWMAAHAGVLRRDGSTLVWN